MNRDQVLKIKDCVRCPQFGCSDYGDWGVLSLNQRDKINKLCDSWLLMDDNEDYYRKRIIKIFTMFNKIKEWDKECFTMPNGEDIDIGYSIALIEYVEKTLLGENVDE